MALAHTVLLSSLLRKYGYGDENKLGDGALSFPFWIICDRFPSHLGSMCAIKFKSCRISVLSVAIAAKADCLAQLGPLWPSSAQARWFRARLNLAQPGSAQTGPAWLGSALLLLRWPGLARPGSDQLSSTRRGCRLARPGPAQFGSAQNPPRLLFPLLHHVRSGIACYGQKKFSGQLSSTHPGLALGSVGI